MHCVGSLIRVFFIRGFATGYILVQSTMGFTINCLCVIPLSGKTPEEIRKTFNIKNDFTPEEEEQVSCLLCGSSIPSNILDSDCC